MNMDRRESFAHEHEQQVAAVLDALQTVERPTDPGFFSLEKDFGKQLPPSIAQDPRVQSAGKEILRQFIREVPDAGVHRIEFFITSILKFFQFSGATLLDADIKEDAVQAMETCIERFTSTHGEWNETKRWEILSSLVRIAQYQEFFGISIRPLTREEQERLAPLLVQLGQHGESLLLEDFFDLFHLHELDAEHMGPFSEEQEEKMRTQAFQEKERVAQLGAFFERTITSVAPNNVEKKMAWFRTQYGDKISLRVQELFEQIGRSYATQATQMQDQFFRCTEEALASGAHECRRQRSRCGA